MMHTGRLTDVGLFFIFFVEPINFPDVSSSWLFNLHGTRLPHLKNYLALVKNSTRGAVSKNEDPNSDLAVSKFFGNGLRFSHIDHTRFT